MDVVKAAIFGAGAYVLLNLALSFTVGGSVSLLYLLPPLLAGIVASAYHAQFGVGGWPRHLLAVMIAPLFVAIYIVVVRYVNAGEISLINAGGGLLTTSVAALAGMGIVMGVRFLLGFRSQTDLDGEDDSGEVGNPARSPRAVVRPHAHPRRGQP